MGWQIIIEFLTYVSCIFLQIYFTIIFIYHYQRLEVSKSWDKSIFSICFGINILIATLCAILVEDSLNMYPIYFIYSFFPFHLHKIGYYKNEYSHILRWLLPILVSIPIILIFIEQFDLISRESNKLINLIVLITVYLVTEILFQLYYYKRVASGTRHHGYWANLNVLIDNLYKLILFSIVIIYALNFDGKYSIILNSILLIMLTGLYCACIIRKTHSQIYIFWRKHEKKIIEAMKSSLIQIKEDDGLEAIYKEVYDRVLEYVKEGKAFLDGNLSINDVAKSTFSNKVYVSRAISMYTGRNFCQFINYFRIKYSVKDFEENPHLKVSELALRSGFHSAVSYNTSFKLFMNEAPSEWCRRTRARMSKKKK